MCSTGRKWKWSNFTSDGNSESCERWTVNQWNSETVKGERKGGIQRNTQILVSPPWSTVRQNWQCTHVTMKATRRAHWLCIWFWFSIFKKVCQALCTGETLGYPFRKERKVQSLLTRSQSMGKVHTSQILSHMVHPLGIKGGPGKKKTQQTAHINSKRTECSHCLIK